ncbi:UNVERIFIED_ORG: hypothetical protein GGR78_000571 [Xanthomonas campestris]
MSKLIFPIHRQPSRNVPVPGGSLSAVERCLSACAARDRSHAKALKRRSMSKGPKRHPKRSDRIVLIGLRAEASSRDFVRELRA